MKLTVNGEECEAPASVTVVGLLRHLKLEPARVAIEVNRALVPRSRHDQLELVDGDTVEIVTFVGGG